MRNRNNKAARVLLLATGLVVARMTTTVNAAINIDGSLDAAYGAPLAVQTNNTGFGDNPGNSAGSELDAAYGTIQNGNLDLFFTGNLEFGDINNNYNHLNIFIADGRAGQSTLSAGGSLSSMTGSTFSPGFSATYALDINGNTSGTFFNYNDLTQSGGPSHYYGSITPNNGQANVVTNQTTPSVLIASFNNSNSAGVNGSSPSAASASAATAVTTGLEVQIPLSVLGSPTGSIKVLADVNGGGNSYLANQFLPGLPTVEGNVGAGGTAYSETAQGAFNFANTPNQYFTVAAASSSSNTIGIYNSATGGNYNVPASWLNGKVPLHAGDSATFGSSITAPATITLNSNPTIGRLTFNSSNSYTIAPGVTTPGTLTIDDTGDSTGVNPLITVSLGSHTISAPVALANGVTFVSSASTSLTVSGVLSGAGNVIKDGPGSLILTAANIFTSPSATILNGTVELDNPAAGSGAQWFIGDPTSELQTATLNVGVAGLTIPNSIVTNHDGSGANSYRVISGSYATGNATFTGNLYLDGAVVLTVPAGATLTYAGVIANGQDGSVVANHDLIVGVAGATTGTVVLSALNTYSTVTNGSGQTNYGDTFVNSGTLSIPLGAGISSGFVTVNTGATLLAAGSLSPTASLYDYGTTTLGSSNGTSQSVTPLGAIIIGQAALLTVVPATNHSGRTIVTTSTLSITGSTDNWTGKVDLGNNDLDVSAGSLADITNQIKQGYNLSGGGNFSGLGITSSTAAADSRHLTALGVIVNSDKTGNPIFTSAKQFDGTTPGASDVLVKYTYFGDANLDGKVDGSDYSLIDAGYASNKPGFSGTVLTGWYNGDFNYDGVIDGSDYTLIDNAFNNQKVNLSSAALVATATAQVSPTAVPEPALFATTVVAGIALLKRRRR